MTLPFFGSGIVELPPDGFKRAKNSRKMQMVFFVHEGKVLVTVGPPTVEQNGAAASDAETNEFAISKGGVWVVPRGMFLMFFPFQSPSRHRNPPARAQRHTSPPSRDPRTNRTLEEERSARPASSSFESSKMPCRSRAVCATSRRNNLTIAPEHRTSCVSLHRRPVPVFPGTVLPLGNRQLFEGLHRRCQRARVFGCTTGCPVAWEAECRATCVPRFGGLV